MDSTSAAASADVATVDHTSAAAAAAAAAAITSDHDATPLKKRRSASDASSPSLAAIRLSGSRARRGVPTLLPCVAGDNPLLAALGGTPRSSAAAARQEPEPLTLDWSGTGDDAASIAVGSKRKRADEPPVAAKLESHAKAESVKSEPVVPGVKTEPAPAKPEFVKPEFVAYAREHIHSQEAGEEGFSIDPSDRAVEHRANKLVRREILIASPAANDDDEWEGSTQESMLENPEEEAKPAEHFDMQPVDMILHVFSFLVSSSEDFYAMAQVSKRWRELTSRRSLCRALPSTLPDGSVNWLNFQNLGIKNKGTEGTCFKCHQRSTGKILAMKKARVFPKVRMAGGVAGVDGTVGGAFANSWMFGCSQGEGVPYYMLRELAVLKGIKHDHIASLEMISLAKDELHVFFPYVDKTLHEIINPTGDPNGGRTLPEPVVSLRCCVLDGDDSSESAAADACDSL